MLGRRAKRGGRLLIRSQSLENVNRIRRLRAIKGRQNHREMGVIGGQHGERENEICFVTLG